LSKLKNALHQECEKKLRVKDPKLMSLQKFVIPATACRLSFSGGAKGYHEFMKEVEIPGFPFCSFAKATAHKPRE